MKNFKILLKICRMPITELHCLNAAAIFSCELLQWIFCLKLAWDPAVTLRVELMAVINPPESQSSVTAVFSVKDFWIQNK